jgi:hypothetical protein
MDAAEVGMGLGLGVEAMGRARALGARLQLTVEAVRGSPANARFVEDRLRTIPGVVEVAANPNTGGVHVLYDPRANGGVIETARALTVVPKREIVVAVRRPGGGSLLARVVKFATVLAIEVALQRVLGPLFLPRRC